MEFGSWTNGLSWEASNAYDNYYLSTPYIKGIQEGKYSTKELDEKVRRVLRLFYRTTMNPDKPHGFLCSDQHYGTAKQVAEEGIVLLKNKKNVLPIDVKKAKKMLVVGENAIKMMTVGGGSSSLKVQKEILPLDGLNARLSKEGISVDYARGYVGDVITFTVNVKNVGKRAGAEVVQLYIHDVKSSIDRPYKELKGFQKIYLQPGENKDVNITIQKDALSYYDEATASWKAEAGQFEALVGNAADNLKLKKTFELK